MKLLLAILFATTAWAVPFGQDHLGGVKYQKAILKTFNQGEGFGVFANTFGDALPLIKKVVQEKPRFIRIQLAWSDSHSFPRKDFPKIVKEAKRFCPTATSNPQIRWYFSGACEHKLNAQDAEELAKKVTMACPAARYVNTPMHGGAILQDYINEVHGAQAPPNAPYIAYSFDGTSAEDSDVETIKQKFSRAEYFMLWSPRYNGRWESNDTTPRPNRRGFADEKMIRSMQYLQNTKGPVSLPNKYLWKSHSENKGNGDSRAEKPVLIFPQKVKKVELKRNGQTVAVMPYFGAYLDGRHRYYAPKWGYEIGQVDVFVKGSKVGTVDSGFRSAPYR